MQTDQLDVREQAQWTRRADEFIRLAVGNLYESEAMVVQGLSAVLNTRRSMVDCKVLKEHDGGACPIGMIIFDFRPMRAACMIAHTQIALSEHSLLRFAEHFFRNPIPTTDTMWSWRDPSFRISLQCCYSIIRDGSILEATPDVPFQRVLLIEFHPAMEDVKPLPFRQRDETLH